MEKVTIQAASREGIGVKGALSQIRAEKKVPAVVYGGHKDPASITVAVKDLEKIMKAGKNTLVEMTLNGEKELVLVKEVQFHAVTDNPIHADFQRVSMKDKIENLEKKKLDAGTEGQLLEFRDLLVFADQEPDLHTFALIIRDLCHSGIPV